MTGETRPGWLADFRGDGTVAFVRASAEMPGVFTNYSRENLGALRAEMRRRSSSRKGSSPKKPRRC